MIEWLEHFGLEHGLDAADLARFDELARPNWLREAIPTPPSWPPIHEAGSTDSLGQATVRRPQTLTLGITGPVNAVLARAVATGTITDSFVPTPAAAPVLTHLTQTHTSWREAPRLALTFTIVK